MRKKREIVRHALLTKQGYWKGFRPPYRDYSLETASYQDIFDAVNGQIELGMYRISRRANFHEKGKGLPKSYTNNKTTNEMIRDGFLSNPALLTSKDELSRHLAGLFGELIERIFMAPTKLERQVLKTALDKILGPQKSEKSSKKEIPPGLSLLVLCEYVHFITEDLREKYINNFGSELLPVDDMIALAEVDTRLIDIAKKGFITALIASPMMLTKRMVAENFNLADASALEQYTLRTEGRKSWKKKRTNVL